jgi:hypothetical protein
MLGKEQNKLFLSCRYDQDRSNVSEENATTVQIPPCRTVNEVHVFLTGLTFRAKTPSLPLIISLPPRPSGAHFVVTSLKKQGKNKMVVHLSVSQTLHQSHSRSAIALVSFIPHHIPSGSIFRNLIPFHICAQIIALMQQKNPEFQSSRRAKKS